MAENNSQRTPGRRQPCCVSMAWALKLGYIERGYMWANQDGPLWIPWIFNFKGPGWIEKSPIHYCPFSGHNLDEPED